MEPFRFYGSVHRATVPSVNSFTLPDTLPAVLLVNPGACVTGASGLRHTDRAVERHRRRVAARCPFLPPYHVGCLASRAMRPRIFPNRRCVKWLPDPRAPPALRRRLRLFTARRNPRLAWLGRRGKLGLQLGETARQLVALGAERLVTHDRSLLLLGQLRLQLRLAEIDLLELRLEPRHPVLGGNVGAEGHVEHEDE